MSKLFLVCLLMFAVTTLFLDAQVSQEMATITGRIVFQGTLPTTRRINMAVDPYCASRPSASQNPQEDVMVYVSSPVPTTFTIPERAALLYHRDCMFVPHVLTMQAGQKLIIRNDDATVQNFHAWASINPPFSISQDRQGLENIHTFDKEEPSIPVRDDIFNWKSAFIGVFAHPYHTVSKLNATYELKVPGGAYEITSSHEKYGKQTQWIEIKNGDNRILDFAFK